MSNVLMDAHQLLAEALQRWGRSPDTQQTYLRALRFARRHGLDASAFCNGSGAAWRAGEAYRSQRPATGPGGRRKDVRMLNALARACHEAGHHEARVRWPMPAQSPPRRHALQADELERLLAYRHHLVDHSTRNRALLEVALLTGASKAELSMMDVEHLDERGLIYVRGAKGHATDWIPVEPEIYRPDGALVQWLKIRLPPVGDESALWTTLRGPRHRLQPSGVARVLQRIGQATRVPLTSRITRHTRGRRMWLHGWPEELVQLMLRLHSRDVVRTYTELGLEDLVDWMRQRGGPGLRGEARRRGACPLCGRSGSL